jgi:uncharacterized protein
MSQDCPKPSEDDLFVLPADEDSYYLYAPLRRCVAVVNGAAVAAVERSLRMKPGDLTQAEAAAVRTLEHSGLIGGCPPAPPLFPVQGAFTPHEVTLFPTSRCNLRCRYCYANAGHKSVDMSWPVAQAAIDLVAENAGRLGSPRFGVGFHGGGEPLLVWDLVVRSVEYARAKAEEKGLTAEIYAASNGLLSPEQREYVVRHFSSLNVSIDGPPDLNDHNRPRPNGQGSYAAVSESLKDFDRHGFTYGIRATITAATVGRMVEIVDHLATEFHPIYLHLEPVWQCGRCLMTGETTADQAIFIGNFRLAAEHGRTRGIDVTYSGARLGTLVSKFCAAPGDGFSVLPEGVVTSCFDITETTDPRARIFHFGHYDATLNAFVFDQERVSALRALSVENLSFCRDCFCRWHCAGDCLAKVFERSGSSEHRGSPRCDLNRALTLAELRALVRPQGGTAAMSEAP